MNAAVFYRPARPSRATFAPDMDAQTVIRTLGLAAHPEGGYFRETYRSAESVAPDALPGRYAGARSFSTSIYFLLTGDQRSAFHRLQSDELWHYHLGDAVTVHLLHDDGRHETIVVGPDLAAGERPLAVIPAGVWFGAKVNRTDGYVLLGCTVAPGFDFADFELARRDPLTAAFPHHAELIRNFTD